MRDPEDLDELLDRDWGDAWESLPPAPPLVLAQPKSAQVTLRVPAELVTSLRAIARHKSLAYHALARSLITEALRLKEVPTGAEEAADLGAPADTQLNIKIPTELLEELKRFSHQTRRPYHRLARIWLERGVRREREAVASGPQPMQPSLKEILILLLDSPSPGRRDAAVRGMTRLQKLVFVIDQQLGTEAARFYSHSYGPFDEQVSDAADALRARGLLTGGTGEAAEPPSVEEMMSSVLRRRGPRTEIFELTAEGRSAAAELRRKDAAYARLASQIERLRQQWDRPDLVERVYEAFPEYTDRSLIKDKVTRRAASRRAASRRSEGDGR